MKHKIHVSAVDCRFLGYNNTHREYYCKLTGNYLSGSTQCMRCKFSEIREKENRIRNKMRRKGEENGRVLRLA